MKKYKKLLIFVLSFILISTLFLFPASALTTGGLDILGVSGSIWQPLEKQYYYATVVNQDDNILFNYQWNSFNGTVMTEVELNLNGPSYGKLSLSYQSAFGSTSPVNDFEGIYDGSTGAKLSSFAVGSDYYAVVYEGKIPSKLLVRGHFTCTSSDVIQSYTILNVSFTNLESEQIIKNQDKNANEIKENQDKNTDKALYGKDYDSVDDSTVNDYVDSEAKLMDSLTSGFDTVDDYFSSFTGNVSQGNKAALSFISVFMNKFLDIPEFGSIYKIALTFGMFAFVVGSALLAIGLFSGYKRNSIYPKNKKGG